MNFRIPMIRTALALGLPNLARVVIYRFAVRTGLHPVRRLRAEIPRGPFFSYDNASHVDVPVSREWNGALDLFGWHLCPVSDIPPDWHQHPLTGQRHEGAGMPWWQIPDFISGFGDVKAIWEASRFAWVLTFVQHIREGQPGMLDRLNAWLSDWCEKNPPYLGPNWKCGQEASIRVMHLAMAAYLLEDSLDQPRGLADLIQLHLERIEPTVGYAMAQDNNHGTSEAAALFIGGSWLQRLGIDKGRSCYRRGLKLLENRVTRLIEKDGSFSQYSLNYHRLLLDTLSIVEIWRQHLGLPEFTREYQGRVAAASRWLMAMVDPHTGDGPNFGANDGARLLPLTNSDYRDFRSSVQMSMALFAGEKAYPEDGPWNVQLAWLRVGLPKELAKENGSRLFDDGGYGLLKRGRAMVLLRYPRFRFRPAHADALHLDFWLEGTNFLRDAGTYSYNTGPEWLAYFPGTVSHNTVQLDDRDQMPRLSRFLFGDWLETGALRPLIAESNGTTFGAVYQDSRGGRHQRYIQLSDDSLIVRDEVSGFLDRAVLRWRVRPGQWQLQSNCLTDGRHVLSVSGTIPIARIELVQGWESRYYLQKNRVPVLEVEINEPGILTTEYHWKI